MILNSNNRKNRILKIVLVTLVTLIAISLGLFGGNSSFKNGDKAELLTLEDFTELFSEDILIVIGEEASSVEKKAAKLISNSLENDIESKPTVLTNKKLSRKQKEKNSLIILGTPTSNGLLQEIYQLTDATEITKGYPGKYRGLLQTIESLWNENQVVLLATGIDKWGVKSGAEKLVKGELKVRKKEQLVGPPKLLKIGRCFVNNYTLSSPKEATGVTELSFATVETVADIPFYGRGKNPVAYSEIVEPPRLELSDHKVAVILYGWSKTQGVLVKWKISWVQDDKVLVNAKMVGIGVASLLIPEGLTPSGEFIKEKVFRLRECKREA